MTPVHDQARPRRSTLTAPGALVLALLVVALLVATLLAVTVPASTAGAPPAVADPAARPAPAERGPRLTEPRAALRRAVTCDARERLRSARRVVVLVHGTATTPRESWSWGYERALRADGFASCRVALPAKGLGEVTRAAEYVVAAVRTAARRSGGRVAIVGHSQGGFLGAWVTRWWPDVARRVHDVVSLAGAMDGTALGNELCVLGRCHPVAWQFRRGSRMVRALRAVAPPPRRTATTSIATRYDEVVRPQPEVNRLAGARSIVLQDVCPNDPVEHNLLLGDPLAYALVLDALTRPGPADPARVPRSVCRQAFIPHGDPVGAAQGLRSMTRFLTGLLDPRSFVAAEPPLPRYAR